jgi:hypothetical protein
MEPSLIYVAYLLGNPNSLTLCTWICRRQQWFPSTVVEVNVAAMGTQQCASFEFQTYVRCCQQCTLYNGYKLSAKQGHSTRISPCWEVRIWYCDIMLHVRLSSWWIIISLLALRHNNYDQRDFSCIWLRFTAFVCNKLLWDNNISSYECRTYPEKIFENIWIWSERNRKRRCMFWQIDWIFFSL